MYYRMPCPVFLLPGTQRVGTPPVSFCKRPWILQVMEWRDWDRRPVLTQDLFCWTTVSVGIMAPSIKLVAAYHSLARVGLGGYRVSCAYLGGERQRAIPSLASAIHLLH